MTAPDGATHLPCDRARVKALKEAARVRVCPVPMEDRDVDAYLAAWDELLGTLVA